MKDFRAQLYAADARNDMSCNGAGAARSVRLQMTG
jgi:hypothetical protein